MELFWRQKRKVGEEMDEEVERWMRRKKGNYSQRPLAPSPCPPVSQHCVCVEVSGWCSCRVR